MQFLSTSNYVTIDQHVAPTPQPNCNSAGPFCEYWRKSSKDWRLDGGQGLECSYELLLRWLEVPDIGGIDGCTSSQATEMVCSYLFERYGPTKSLWAICKYAPAG
jgi:hypothetical protein